MDKVELVVGSTFLYSEFNSQPLVELALSKVP